MTQRFKLTIEYDGTDFAGWQRQESGISTVQQVMEDAIEKFIHAPARLHVAGRTDAGVHATGQVAHIDIDNPRIDAKAMRDATNFHMGDVPVKVIAAEEVHAEFHARFHATMRTYCYRILMNRTAPPAAWARTLLHVWKDLDIAAMNEGAQHLLGTHDFSSFRAAECQAKQPKRTMHRLEFMRNETWFGAGSLIELWAEAPSFLHHQIRNIVGSLVFVGEGRWQPDDIKKALDACNRCAAGPTAPPTGLFLTSIKY